MSEHVRDRLRIWGHEAGSHGERWGLPGHSRMTAAEGAVYLGVPNLLMVRYEEKPVPPYEQYAIPFRALQRVVWSIVGADGETDKADRTHVLELAAGLPNMTGVIMEMQCETALQWLRAGRIEGMIFWRAVSAISTLMPSNGPGAAGWPWGLPPRPSGRLMFSEHLRCRTPDVHAGHRW